jgi:hypothetical protein
MDSGTLNANDTSKERLRIWPQTCRQQAGK